MGRPHITSDRIRNFNAAIFGAGKYVVDTGSKFSYEIISNNQIKINDGQLISQGTHACIDLNNYEELQIDTGLQGLNRNDLIVARYTRNKITDAESMQMVVIKGTSSEDAADPPYITGDVLLGASEDDMPLYRVRLNGLNIVGVDCLFDTIPSMAMIHGYIESLKANKDWVERGNSGYLGTNQTTFTEYSIKDISAYSEVLIVSRHWWNVNETITLPMAVFKTLTEDGSRIIMGERVEIKYINPTTIGIKNYSDRSNMNMHIFAR